jgi:methionine-rich copper-binding protein CopC
VKKRIREVVAMFKNLLLAILSVLSLAANAHSPIVSSSPKNGEMLDLPPTEIVMEFKSPAKLIKIDLTKSSDKQGKSLLGGLFGGDDGESMPLGTSSLMTIDKRQVIRLPSLEEGRYTLKWRAMGEDGHVIKGDLTFTIQGS